MRSFRWFMITLMLIAGLSIISWVKAGDAFHLAETFPLLGGYEPGIYDLGAGAVLVIAAWGLVRLGRNRNGGG